MMADLQDIHWSERSVTQCKDLKLTIDPDPPHPYFRDYDCLIPYGMKHSEKNDCNILLGL